MRIHTIEGTIETCIECYDEAVHEGYCIHCAIGYGLI